MWTVRDLGSAEGTLLNGRPLSTSEELHKGDMLRLGESRLLVVEGEPRPPRSLQPRRAQVELDQSAQGPWWEGESEAAEAAPSLPPAPPWKGAAVEEPQPLPPVETDGPPPVDAGPEVPLVETDTELAPADTGGPQDASRPGLSGAPETEQM
jgi:pSer/pThr/pTyr-binding forkhead associated (FHA) protein